MFSNITFKGCFRPYQQQVLDHLETHSEDNQVHIVAAPGSGKTVLGLEFIRRFGQPALVLSPTVLIQHQWGQRFEEFFLPEGAAPQKAMSYDLHAPALITSLTYQGLYAAWKRVAEKVADEYDDESGLLDYQGFDLLKAIRKAGIRTICLDEAHHLKAAWQRALEEFVAAVKEEVTIISLTATPPYDATPTEWARYIALCGEIDDEISTPTLVQQGILCPHQDFIVFNRPTCDEEAAMLDFQRRAYVCVQEILNGPLLASMLDKGHVLDRGRKWTNWRYCNTKGVQALLVLAAHKGISIPRSIAVDMFPRGRVPEFKMEYAQLAFQFVLDHVDVFSPELTMALHKKLADAGLLVRKKVCMETDARLNRRLAGSAAKLESIGKIAAAEQTNLGEKLRMLILTDFIGKEFLPLVGGGAPLAGLDAVSVFETVRRAVTPGTPAAVLTGTLVLVPGSTLGYLEQACKTRGITYSAQACPGTDYHEISFGAGNSQKVAVLTELFQAGHIHIMVGTKSLLGEGWDSPCINSLVLASYVGSFVLSNQMRGRAIRKNPNEPNKVSNIWHLVTVLPPSQQEDGLQEPIESDDFTTLVRRFECFMGPSYNGNTIESGIGRINILCYPANQSDIDEMNRQMLERAAGRRCTAASWSAALPAEYTPEILDVAAIPYKATPPRFIFANVLHASSLTMGIAAVIGFLWYIPDLSWSWQSHLLVGAVCLTATGFLLRGYYLLLRILSPKKYIWRLGQSLFFTLRELGEITSPKARFVLESDAHGIGFTCALAGGTLREKKLFSKALEELFSPFDSPRYLIVRQRRILFCQINDYSKSYACPSVIARHRKHIDVFSRVLSQNLGPFHLFFTGNNRQALLKGLKRSYINRNGAFIESKRLVRRSYNAAQIAQGTRRKAWRQVKRFFKSLLPVPEIQN